MEGRDRSPARELALVAGLPAALRQLRAWLRRPLPVVAPWVAVSLAIGSMLLLLVWLVAELSPPDPERPRGVPLRPSFAPEEDLRHILMRNLVVLALHATACLAGYIVHAALRETTAEPDRLEQVTRATARVAIWWVPVATLLSIGTQAWILGGYASTLAEHLHMAVPVLLLTTLPHALPELAAVFLPLAAWLVAMRRRRLGELYAATIASVLVALPVLVGAAWLEANTWHDRVQAAPLVLPELECVEVGTLGALDPADVRILRLGPPLSDDVLHRTEPAAVEVARDASRGRAGAVAVVELGGRWRLYELHLHRVGGECEPGDEGDRVDLERDASRPLTPGPRTIPGSVVELDVDAIADGAHVIDPSVWVGQPFQQQGG